jgi:hypothetical protein
MKVYKYLPPYDYVFDSVLENSRIRFTQPDLFNDPFESFPSFAEEKKQKIEQVKAEFKAGTGFEIPPDSLNRILKEFYQELSAIPTTLGKSLVSLCVTKRNNNALMWSHYAESHKGLAVGFNSDCSFFQPGNGKAKQGLREVIYSEKRESAFTGNSISNMDEELEKYFFTKSCDWEYEEELRICAFTQFADVKDNFRGEDLYLFSFPTECVEEIILGFRMSEENKKKTVEIANRIYPTAKLFQAILSETDFDLDILPYSA